jgi:hypothetical protein
MKEAAPDEGAAEFFGVLSKEHLRAASVRRSRALEAVVQLRSRSARQPRP